MNLDTSQSFVETGVQLVLDARAMLGEGALWSREEKKLYWVDIEGRTLHRYDPATKRNESFNLGSRIGTVVPVAGGGVLVALQNGIHKLDTQTGDLRFITNPLTGDDIRFNDGKCDPSGRFWVGTMALDTRPGAGTLYRMNADKSMHTMLEGVTISNGIVWTADKKTLYYVDTSTQTVQAFDFEDATGSISNGRVVIRIPEQDGSPDGMTIDAEGKLWIALWGGFAVGRFDPEEGRMIGKIPVPAPHVSSCAFGGNELDTLYITTARVDLDAASLEAYPLSGGLFAVKPGVKGVPAQSFTESA